MKEDLALLYKEHHRQRGRYDYLFCQGERIPWLSKWIGKGKRVLDLGCRDGALTQAFAEGNEVIGVDVDPEALRRIKERLSIETYWLDLNGEWPFAKDSFDVIVSCELFEHLLFPARLLGNIALALKEGGLSIGSVPNAFRLRNRIRFLQGEEFDKDPTHLHLFSYTKLQGFLETSFSEVTILPLGGHIAPLIPCHPALPKRVGALFAKDLLWCATNGIRSIFV
ncbi:MAG: class I SAM-dependent methyltransferase [Verrucomicrobiota bacterium]|nr:class I SAM-dependent methyltransferase [Verrucomicrobiota bacterium]